MAEIWQIFLGTVKRPAALQNNKKNKVGYTLSFSIDNFICVFFLDKEQKAVLCSFTMEQITDTFESRQAAKIVGVPERTWRYWATNGLIIPLEDAVGRPGIRRRYSFKNLVQGAILRDLAKQKITLSVGKKALKHLGERSFDDKTACYLLIIDGGDEIQVLSKLTMEEIEKQTASFSQTITVMVVHNISRAIQQRMRMEQD